MKKKITVSVVCDTQSLAVAISIDLFKWGIEEVCLRLDRRGWIVDAGVKKNSVVKMLEFIAREYRRDGCEVTLLDAATNLIRVRT